jgi:hypothetical protein
MDLAHIHHAENYLPAFAHEKKIDCTIKSQGCEGTKMKQNP